MKKLIPFLCFVLGFTIPFLYQTFKHKKHEYRRSPQYLHPGDGIFQATFPKDGYTVKCMITNMDDVK